ncbi:uncharacterized protein [Halyomorpha halys]|uniref:uncharacterized protein n=1 Tax=Halyomorpha halys TaxID=286706 RepID=UPI0006D50346|nr:uncharacterized protein LOC106683547 [Halyomorpha halys]
MTTYLHVCKICKKTYTTGSNLNKHVKKHSARVESPRITYRLVKTPISCILCESLIPKKDLHQHFESEHEITICSSQHRFETMDQFLQWKHSIEQKTVSSFVKYKSDRVLNNGSTKIAFVCHRSGFYKSTGKNIRQIKKVGSNKIGGLCPAQILVIQTSDEVLVEFTETHVGHTMDKSRLVSTPTEKNNIASKTGMKTLKDPMPNTINKDYSQNATRHLVMDSDSLKGSDEQDFDCINSSSEQDYLDNQNGRNEQTTVKQIEKDHNKKTQSEFKNSLMQKLSLLTELVEQTYDDGVLEVINNTLKPIQTIINSLAVAKRKSNKENLKNTKRLKATQCFSSTKNKNSNNLNSSFSKPQRKKN